MLRSSPWFSFGTVLGTQLPPAEPGAITLAQDPVPVRDLGDSPCRWHSAAGQASTALGATAPVQADAGGTMRQRRQHRPGRRIVSAPRGVMAGGEPGQSTEGTDPAAERPHCPCAELLAGQEQPAPPAQSQPCPGQAPAWVGISHSTKLDPRKGRDRRHSSAKRMPGSLSSPQHRSPSPRYRGTAVQRQPRRWKYIVTSEQK